MSLSRRDLIRTGFVAGGAIALGGRPASAWALDPVFPVAPQGSTLAQTLVRGVPGAGGYRKVVIGGGEPHTVRNDLGAPRSVGTRTAIVAFAQLTDVHLTDSESPMRVEYVDRFEDQYTSGDPVIGLLTSSYRPQEMLTTQVAESMVRRINSFSFAAPTTGRPLDFAIQTGDNADNCQLNELRWNIDLLDGGTTIRPDSGSTSAYEGVSARKEYDPHYWHPEPGTQQDLYHTDFGFPDVRGLLDTARRSFTATGLRMPWYTAHGNHDGLVQGNFPSTLPLTLVAQGRLKITGVPPGVSQADVLRALRGVNATPLLGALALNSADVVTGDARRRVLTRKQTVAEHFNTTGTPVGHGFTQTNVNQGTAYYTFRKNGVLGIVLDTCNPNGYAEGSIDKPQFDWLKQVLASNHGDDELVVIYSHHTSATMTNPLRLTGLDLRERVLGPAVVTELLKHPNVVAWVNGHTHQNGVAARKGPLGSGFWEINTASHVDFPQQARIIELVDNGDGTLSIFCTMVDHASPASTSINPTSPMALASWSRELAANDPQERGGITAVRDGRRGSVLDRNVELIVKKPY